MSKRDKKHKDTTRKPRPQKDETLMSILKRKRLGSILTIVFKISSLVGKPEVE